MMLASLKIVAPEKKPMDRAIDYVIMKVLGSYYQLYGPGVPHRLY
jgi:hypothetical protein